MGGLTGALFTEFAFTLAGAVTISAIIALTLIAHDVFKIFKMITDKKQIDLLNYIDKQFEKLQ